MNKEDGNIKIKNGNIFDSKMQTKDLPIEIEIYSPHEFKKTLGNRCYTKDEE